MNRKAAYNLAWLPVLAMVCFSCSLGAQQPSGTAAAGPTSMTGASSTTGLYSIGSIDRERKLAAGLPSPTSSRVSSQTGMVNLRSTWMAGANSTGRANAAVWNAGDESFRGKSRSSWIAGTGNFSVDRQQDGIWRSMPSFQVEPNMSIESHNSSTPLGLTSKGAAVLKGARSSYSFPERPHVASGTRGSAAGRVANPFSAHAPISGGFGSRIGTKPARHSPSSGTIPDHPLHDTSGLDENLR